MEGCCKLKTSANRRMVKRGQMRPITMLFIILGVLLILAFVSALVLAGIKWGSNQITPITENLGTVGGANLSQAATQTFGTVDTMINLLPLLVGFGYFFLLVGCIAIVSLYRTTANPIFMGLFFVLMVILILVAILVSNTYEDVYNGTDVIATELQSYTLLSFLILNSPIIFGAVGFIAGIFLFGGKQNELAEGGYYG